jgi:hypothetical protein
LHWRIQVPQSQTEDLTRPIGRVFLAKIELPSAEGRVKHVLVKAEVNTVERIPVG